MPALLTRKWISVLLALVILAAVRARWSLIQPSTSPAVKVDERPLEERIEPSFLFSTQTTLVKPTKTTTDPVVAASHLAAALHSLAVDLENNDPDLESVLELDGNKGIKGMLGEYRSSKSDHSLHLDLSKSTWHYKQLKNLDVDLDALREQQPNHYPPWNQYKNRDYDPNRWHFFPLEEKLYQCTVNDSLSSPGGKSVPVKPETAEGSFVSCVGPRGVRLDESPADWVYAHNYQCKKFPQPLFGSHNALGLNESVCFTRESRYGAYGLGSNSDPASVLLPNPTQDSVHWDAVKWGALQENCYAENEVALSQSAAGNRSAILIRTWDAYKYQANDLHAIRSLVAETALHGHGEYQVYLFVQVKDLSLQLNDSAVWQEILHNNVPPEFHDMTILWNEDICVGLYPDVGDNSVYWQQWQPIQWFAQQHPEFEYVWNWEMDARYIGHHFHFLDTVQKWAMSQPRKYLWERSSRYFMPAIHQSWHQFFDWVSQVVPPQLAIWGPEPAIDTRSRDFVLPPQRFTDDDFRFGHGEPADLITFLPFFDPENTYWAYRDKIWNYVQGITTPRRVYINTLSRLSRRLLTLMHEENRAGLSMVSEMWPASVALHFNLKAVHAPHPIWSSHVWPKEYANEVYNVGPAASPGTDRDCPYNPDREHYFGNIGFYFWSHLPGTLYRRWLGWNVHDEHGEVQDWEGRPREQMCLPSMLLHPIKGADFDHRGEYRP